MPSMKIYLVFVLLISIFSFTSLANLTYWSHGCSFGKRDSIYIANRNNLVSNLSNTTGHDGFYNTTVGEGPNIVRGLFLCRGDLNLIPENCRNCVKLAAADVVQRCPSHSGGIIWYSECMLRYSNMPIFSSMETAPNYVGPWFNVKLTVKAPESGRFNQLRESLTKDIATRASNSNASLGAKKFATKEANYTKFETLYSLAQCTPDIPGEDCLSCLQIAISYLRVCCKNKPALALFPSCTVQYHVTPFYQQGNRSADSQPPAPSPLLVPSTPPPGKKQGESPRVPIVASLSAIFGLTLLCSGGIFIWRRIYFQENEENNSQEVQLVELLGGGKVVNDYSSSNENFQSEDGVTSQEFPSIQLDILHAATSHFCDENKLGEGGFGPVYKGTLPDGKEIAVKRLSRTSCQGLLEFKNEVMLIARLQHRNLVRLLGCCLEKNEKLLVYEYMSNKSLDVFLFDSSLGVQLGWPKRLSIIKGIARGILYLHEDSRLRIIHRDLKASNVLLDGEMNPKISDFGMARIFGGNQIEASTNRVVGTYGYMAPEYAMEGLFSVKSDVFSFGVLLLEIISGRRNNGFHLRECGESLLTFAWKLWSKGQGMELIDELLVESCVATEVLKCIHIGLLCVQEDPADRPSMSSVIVMLASETITLPRPSQPAFSVGRVVEEPTQHPTSNERVCSINEVTISNLSPR